MADSTAPTTPTKATSAEDNPPSPRRSTRVRKPTIKALDAANQHNKEQHNRPAVHQHKSATEQHDKPAMDQHKHSAADQHNKPATEQHNKHAVPNRDKPTAAAQGQAQHDNKPAADQHNDTTKRAPSPTNEEEPPIKRPRYWYAGPYTRARASITPRPRVRRQHTSPATAAACSSQPTTATAIAATAVATAASSSSTSNQPPPSTPRSHHRRRTASRDNANYHLNKGPAYLSSPDRQRTAENGEGEEIKEYSDWEYGGPTESRVRNAGLGQFGAFFFAPYDGTMGGGDAENAEEEEEEEGREEGAVADIVSGKVNRGYGDLLGP